MAGRNLHHLTGRNQIRWPLSSSGCRGCSILSSHIVGSVEYLGRF